jgi:hypothetical protein
MAAQRSGQPLDEGGEHSPVGPVQARSRVGAAQDGDLVAQHEKLDVLRGGRADRQQDQPEHLPEDQVQQPQRHAGIMSDQRSPLVSDPPDFWHPTGVPELACQWYRAGRTTGDCQVHSGYRPDLAGRCHRGRGITADRQVHWLTVV